MTQIDIRLPQLHAGQQAVDEHPARFKVIACGRRWGKTQHAIDGITERLVDGLTCGYFVPSYKMADEVWRTAKSVLGSLIRDKNETKLRIETYTGGALDFWSMDRLSGETARGRKYHHVVVDEAAHAYNGREVWNAVIRPMLTDYRGSAYFYSTPNGLNWFWDIYRAGLDGDRRHQHWQAFHFRTVDNPYIDPDEVEDARHNLPDRLFRQEYLAEFIEDAGGVFRNVDTVCTAPPGIPDILRGYYVMGVDWAREYDFTVISVFDALTQTQVDLDRFNQIGWDLQRGRLRRMVNKWRPAIIWAESNAVGSPNVEALQQEGMPVRGFDTNVASKGPLIDGLALAIESEQIRLLDENLCDGHLADAVRAQNIELKSYLVERMPSGRYKYGVPRGQHDDTVIATALAWHAMSGVQPAMSSALSRNLYNRRPERRLPIA